MSTTLIVLCTLAAAILAYFAVNYKLKRRRLEKLGDMLPGPKALPLIGNTLKFINVRNAKDVWDVAMYELKESQKLYGRLFRYWLGSVLVVIVGDLEHINILLNSPHAATKHWWYVRVLSFMSHGAFGLNGKPWQDMRKAMMRYFPMKAIESYMEVFVYKSEQLVALAENCVGTGVINVHDLVKFYPLDLVAITHLGALDMNEMEENRFDFHHHLEKALEMTFTRALKPQYLIDTIFYMSSAGKKSIKIENDVTAISRKIVQNRLDILQARGVDLSTDFEEEYYTDYIIKKGTKEGWTLQKMALSLTDMVIGGSDTTALGLAYTLLCLAMHPEYQEKAFQEQLDIFGDSDRPATFREAMGMPYLTMCYKEALRLHGVVGVARDLTGDVELGNYTIPEGAGIYLLFYSVHRNEKLYCKPDEYYPDHFLPEAVNNRPKNSFFAFSHGSRGCPGSLYSQVSAKIALSLLIRKFRFTSPLKYKDLQFRFSLMLENLDDYPVEVHYRAQKENSQLISSFIPSEIVSARQR